MEEEIRDEETLEPQEEDSSQEEASSQEEEPLEDFLKEELASSEKLREKNKKLFARAKKAEEKTKRLEAELFALKQRMEKEKNPSTYIDITELTKKISALREFSPEELDYISLIARAKNIPIEEAVKTPEVSLYIQAMREKVAKESKVPEPSTRQLPSEKDYSEWTEEDVRRASLEELEKYREWMKQQRRAVR